MGVAASAPEEEESKLAPQTADAPAPSPVASSGDTADMSAVSIAVSRVVLLTEAQFASLEAELAEAGGKRQTLPDAAREPDDIGLTFAPALRERHTQAFYDSGAREITLRGWWLSESAGDWLLQVPIYEPVPGEANAVRFVKHDIETVPEKILDRLGLKDHARHLREGKAKSMTNLLAQAGVTVCASYSSRASVYTLNGGPSSADAPDGSRPTSLCASQEDDRRLSVSLEALHFDVRHAEDQAVSDLLFGFGNTAPSALKATVARFTLEAKVAPGPPVEQPVAKLRYDLAACICDRGLGSVVPPFEVKPAFYAYLATLRPAHLRSLYRGCVFQPPKGLAEPQDEDGIVLLPPSDKVE